MSDCRRQSAQLDIQYLRNLQFYTLSAPALTAGVLKGGLRYYKLSTCAFGLSLSEYCQNIRGQLVPSALDTISVVTSVDNIISSSNIGVWFYLVLTQKLVLTSKRSFKHPVTYIIMYHYLWLGQPQTHRVRKMQQIIARRNLSLKSSKLLLRSNLRMSISHIGSFLVVFLARLCAAFLWCNLCTSLKSSDMWSVLMEEASDPHLSYRLLLSSLPPSTRRPWGKPRLRSRLGIYFWQNCSDWWDWWDT